MNSNLFTVVGVIIISLLAWLIFSLRRLKTGDGVATLLSQNMQAIGERMDRTTASLNERLDRAAQVVGSVQKEIGQVAELGRSLRDMQDLLRSPKLRGNLGEQVLRDLLEAAFPREHVTMQYKFREGQVVDAILKTDKGLIPIDSKFPMENVAKALKAQNDEEHVSALHEFAKDVRKHIDSIAKKYILPAEGTVDFAIMYIPNEAVYYELMRHEEDLMQHAERARVLPVSPNSFYYFLKVILMAMEGKRIEENIEEVRKLLTTIHTDSDHFAADLGVLTSHINNASGALGRVNTSFAKLTGKIEQVKLLK